MRIAELESIPIREWYDLLTHTMRRPDPAAVHVTELCQPPRVLYLRWKHWDEMVMCPIRAWALFLGTAWHKYFLSHVERLHPEWLIERGLTVPFIVNPDTEEVPPALLSTPPNVYPRGERGVALKATPLSSSSPREKYRELSTIVGTPDILDLKGRRVIDVKLTNVAKGYSKGDPAHKLQTYIYAWMAYKTYEVKIETCELWYFYKDHTLSRAMRERRYTQSPCEVFTYPALDPEEVRNTIKERLCEFLVAVHSGVPPAVCSPEDRWAKSDQYKVVKKGARRATRVYKDPAEAREHASQKEDLRVKAVPGDAAVRCRDWCDVAAWCDFAKSHKLSGYQPYWLQEFIDDSDLEEWPEQLR